MNIRLTNHIAWRFLNDDNLLMELLEMKFKEEFAKFTQKEFIENIRKAQQLGYQEEERWSQFVATYQLLSPDGSRNYYITESVTNNLGLLKVYRDAEGRYDYTIFKHIKPQKCTFILPDNRLVRVLITDNDGVISQIVFEYIKFTRHSGSKYEGTMNSCAFFVNRITGEQCSHFQHSDVKEIEDYLYKLMCFIYLSETEEVILKPGEKMGTKKSGKLINEIKHPLVVITSKWNITSIRTEGFAVSGHFRLQPYGEGRKQVRVQWIDPFEKKGYVRTAKKDLTN